MDKREINVISDCDGEGMLWPRVVFWKGRKIIPRGLLHTGSMKPAQAGGPEWHSYSCRIDGKNANVIYNGATQSWRMSFCGDRLYF